MGSCPLTGALWLNRAAGAADDGSCVHDSGIPLGAPLEVGGSGRSSAEIDCVAGIGFAAAQRAASWRR